MKPPLKPNRRKHRRMDADRSRETRDVQIKFQIFGHGSMSHQGVLMSISEGGLFVRSLELFDEGTPIFLNFKFRGRRVQCLGKVVYIHPPGEGYSDPGMGVKFIRLVKKDLDNIRQIVESFHSDYQFDGLVRNIA